MNVQRKEKGFTIIEVMIALALSSIIAYGIYMALRSGDDQIRTAELKMTIQDSAREGLYKMVQELRQSAPERVAIGAGNNSISFQVPDSANPVDSGYEINWSGAHQIQYAIGGVNNQQVIRTNSTTGTTMVMANDAVSLSFTGNGADPTLVTVVIGVQRTLPNGRVVPNTPLLVSAQAEIRNS